MTPPLLSDTRAGEEVEPFQPSGLLDRLPAVGVSSSSEDEEEEEASSSNVRKRLGLKEDTHVEIGVQAEQCISRLASSRSTGSNHKSRARRIDWTGQVTELGDSPKLIGTTLLVTAQTPQSFQSDMKSNEEEEKQLDGHQNREIKERLKPMVELGIIQHLYQNQLLGRKDEIQRLESELAQAQQETQLQVETATRQVRDQLQERIQLLESQVLVVVAEDAASSKKTIPNQEASRIHVLEAENAALQSRVNALECKIDQDRLGFSTQLSKAKNKIDLLWSVVVALNNNNNCNDNNNNNTNKANFLR
jgi:hypothetical protein